MFEWSRLLDRSAVGISVAAANAIRNGDLLEGERLPPVRHIADMLGVSPTTVSDAWQRLIRAGFLETRGRNGTIVRSATPEYTPRRYRSVTGRAGTFRHNWSTGSPDVEMLPSLGEALAISARSNPFGSYADPPILAGLEQWLRTHWMPATETITVVNGAMDALDRSLRQIVRFGDTVIVEDPTFPPLLDLLAELGCIGVGVAVDREGIIPDALEVACHSHRVRAVVIQPRAQNPTGVSLSASRLSELGALLQQQPDVWIIEDDHSGVIAESPLRTLSSLIPHRTISILGFSKSHGPELRLAAMAGPDAAMQPLMQRRQLGPGWPSRILQGALLELLNDTNTDATIARARMVYRARRSALIARLGNLGVDIPPGDGLNVWIPVPDEQHALLAFATRGIAVAPGSPFFIAGGPPHIRVTIASLEHVDDTVLEALEQAVAIPGSEFAV